MKYLFIIPWVIRYMVYNILKRKLFNIGYIGQPMFVSGLNKVQFGNKVRIFPGMRIECIGTGSITFEKGVSVGQNFHIISGSDLVIGKNTMVSSNVFISSIDHSFHSYSKPIDEQELVIKDTKIGINCFIGTGAMILPGSCIGDNTIVGAGSVVKGSFPEGVVVAGNPAKIIRRYNHLTHEWEKSK